MGHTARFGMLPRELAIRRESRRIPMASMMAIKNSRRTARRFRKMDTYCFIGSSL